MLVQRNAQTIGKKLMGIKVARKDGSRATLARIFLLRKVMAGRHGDLDRAVHRRLLFDHRHRS